MKLCTCYSYRNNKTALIFTLCIKNTVMLFQIKGGGWVCFLYVLLLLHHSALWAQSCPIKFLSWTRSSLHSGSWELPSTWAESRRSASTHTLRNDCGQTPWERVSMSDGKPEHCFILLFGMISDQDRLVCVVFKQGRSLHFRTEGYILIIERSSPIPWQQTT